jgi:hypothetical protein
MNRSVKTTSGVEVQALMFAPLIENQAISMLLKAKKVFAPSVST